MFQPEPRLAPPGSPPFPAISGRKVAILCLCTLGMYELHWFYRCWWAVRLRSGVKVNPLWRSLLFPVFCYPLFTRIKRSAREKGVESEFRPVLAGVWCTVFAVLWRLADELWPTALLTVVPLVVAQQEINRVDAVVTPGLTPDDRFSGWQKVLLPLGGLMLCVILVGVLLSP